MSLVTSCETVSATHLLPLKQGNNQLPRIMKTLSLKKPPKNLRTKPLKSSKLPNLPSPPQSSQERTRKNNNLS
ncbi:unnamed protein product [Brassica oleracea]|uniref:(rape) hypothetical protein n=1 Tax=Brassica napus TaxID=3708 RepID=A0A816IHG7_BRANA|nr:unnamed protein product [Brassica napus]